MYILKHNDSVQAINLFMKILIINSKTINKVKYRNHVFEITLFRLCINNGDVEKFVCFVYFQNLFLKSQNNLLKIFVVLVFSILTGTER